MKFEVFEDSDGVNLKISYKGNRTVFFRSSRYVTDWTQKETWIKYRDKGPDSSSLAVCEYVIKNYDKIYAIWKEETLKRSL